MSVNPSNSNSLLCTKVLIPFKKKGHNMILGPNYREQSSKPQKGNLLAASGHHAYEKQNTDIVRFVYLTLMLTICYTLQEASITQSCLLKTTMNDSEEKKAINRSVKHVARIEIGLVDTKMSSVYMFFFFRILPSYSFC